MGNDEFRKFSVKIFPNIDIYEYPENTPPDLAVDSTTQITLGDLHGNAIKLIHFLKMHNVMDLKKDDFDKLVKIYKKSVNDLTKQDLKQFKDIIDSSDYHAVGLIRLLGDELSDRGANDIFTLFMFETLKNKKIPVEILLSNHGLAFLAAYQNNLSIDANESFFSILGSASISLQRLITLIDKGTISKARVKQLVEESYKPLLKPISYSYDCDDPQNKKIKIYSHAPIDLQTIKGLASMYGIKYRDNKLEDFMATLEAIIDHVQIDIVKNHLFLHQQFNPKKYEPYFYIVESLPPIEFPLLALSWGRGRYQKFTNFSPETADYTVELFVHGHEGPLGIKNNCYPQSYHPNMINLDTYSGRDDLPIDNKRPFMTMMTKDKS